MTANAFLAIVLASLTARLGYQMARSPVLPQFAADLGAAPELLGLIVGASTVTGVFLKLPAGALSDVLGRRRMLIAGALFFALPPFFYPLIAEPYGLLALRFVHGTATAVFSPVAAAYVADLARAERGARLGTFSAANDAGAALGPLAGGAILFGARATMPFTSRSRRSASSRSRPRSRCRRRRPPKRPRVRTARAPNGSGAASPRSSARRRS